MNARILIVDDEESVRVLWKRQLKETGCTIDEAPSIESALEQMKRVPPPDVLLLDLVLEDSDIESTLGKIEVFKQIHPGALIVVATGYATEEIQRRAVAMGADAFFSKLDLGTRSGLALALRAAIARHPRGSRESVAALGDFQEALSKLLPA